MLFFWFLGTTYYLMNDFNGKTFTGHPRIIHRDIKSSNILLENNFHALVYIHLLF